MTLTLADQTAAIDAACTETPAVCTEICGVARVVERPASVRGRERRDGKVRDMSIDRGKARPRGQLSHAGGVVFRGSGKTAEILLVSAKLAPHDWVLPKGHIEPDEAPEDCARREVREEAGVDARPLEFLGYDSYTTPLGKSVVAAFYLMKWVRFVPAMEERRVCWLAIDDALERIPFGGTRRIITAAGERLTTGDD